MVFLRPSKGITPLAALSIVSIKIRRKNDDVATSGDFLFQSKMIDLHIYLNGSIKIQNENLISRGS